MTVWLKHKMFKIKTYLGLLKLAITSFTSGPTFKEPFVPAALSFPLLYCVRYNVLNISKKPCTHGGTRTPNLRFRRPTPYPLGHAGTVEESSLE